MIRSYLERWPSRGDIMPDQQPPDQGSDRSFIISWAIFSGSDYHQLSLSYPLTRREGAVTLLRFLGAATTTSYTDSGSGRKSDSFPRPLGPLAPIPADYWANIPDIPPKRPLTNRLRRLRDEKVKGH